MTHSPSTSSPPFLLKAVDHAVRSLVAMPLEAGLYLVGTPIGNLGDMSLRALATLERVDLIYCEDKRHSQKLLQYFSIATPLASYHEHNSERVRPSLLHKISDGKSVALISDAGMPLISDPGFKLLREARRLDIPVIVVPGPTALISALCLAGQPTDRFLFEGFLPHKRQARQNRLQALQEQAGTLIFYEAPHRVQDCLVDIAKLMPEREVSVVREITKRFEESWSGTATQAAKEWQARSPKGEFVILVSGSSAHSEALQNLDDEQIGQALKIELQTASFRDAVQNVARETGLPRKRIYKIGLSMNKPEDDEA